MIDTVSYQAYCCLLKKELICAMGCTEPIAIAYCAAVSRAALGGLPDKVRIVVSGNIVKNVKSVIVPNTGNRKGLTAAAAIGILGGDEQAELEVISRVSRETIEKLPAYLDATTFEIVPVERGFLLDIEIVCSRGADTATARIVQEHTNIILVEKNGTVLYHKDPQPELADTDSEHLSLRGIYDFVQSCDLADIAPLLERQIADNTAIAEVGLRGQYGAAIGTLLLGGGRATAKEKARAYASAGSDARMNGCEMPVVINSGSGNQGMTVSLPVIVYARELGVSHERLLRALLLSNLLSLHEKKSIGRLSAYCGAVSAARPQVPVSHICTAPHLRILQKRWKTRLPCPRASFATGQSPPAPVKSRLPWRRASWALKWHNAVAISRRTTVFCAGIPKIRWIISVVSPASECAKQTQRSFE